MAPRLVTGLMLLGTLLIPGASSAQGENGGGLKRLPCSPETRYDPAQFRRVVEDLDLRKTLVIEGPEWNDTLIRNCRISSADGDGIVIRDVERLVVTGCNITNVSGSGIRLRSTGSTSDVTLDGNEIVGAGRNGISAAQRAAKLIDHKSLKLLNNRIENSGMRSSDGLTHGIYIQAQDALVEGNVVSGRRDGNGISLRSSGTVRCNRVDGTSTVGKPAIRYYSDHVSGPRKRLSIENNDLRSDQVGIDLSDPVALKNEPMSLDHVVTEFIIRNNSVKAPVPVRISSQYRKPPFSIITEGGP